MCLLEVMHDVLIHSPYPRQKSQGNAVTALRMQNLLLESGFDVAIHERGDSPMDTRCLIALNARKSAEEIVNFQQRQPESAIVALLTGTDVNHPEMEDSNSATINALKISTSIVSLHEGFSHRIPDFLQAKTSVIYPSVQLPAGLEHRATHPPKVIVAGNFRDEKNPNLMMEAARKVVDLPLHFHAYGAGADYQQSLEEMVEGYPHFHFHGVQEHDVVLSAMQGAQLLLNTSTEEGGANAICEAVAMGLPVIASRIDGNVGMLGADYAGFFTSGDVRSLTELLNRISIDTEFYLGIKQQIQQRARLFDYQREAEQWAQLVRKMTK